MKRLVRLVVEVVESLRVLAILPRVERTRQRGDLRALVEKYRTWGRCSPRRDPQGRRLLRRAIGHVDARVPGGPHCLRRALLEIALDADAAEQPLRVGLHRDGTCGLAGHVWIAGSEEPVRHYPLSIDLS